MKTHCVIQKTLLSALWRPKWDGNPRQNIYIHMCVCVCVCVCVADSLYCTEEPDTPV